MKVRFAVAPHGALAAEQLVEFGDAVETAGFDGVWLSDLPVSPTLDPLVALAVLAGRSSRMHLGANVVPLGHNPHLLAKSLANLDRLSGGRLLLSFVTGLHRRGEREVLGIGDASRGDVLEESPALLRAWWAGETVTHHSERWSFDAVASPGHPAQDPLEVWLGGRGPQALERVGRIADGWLGAAIPPSGAAGAREQIQSAAAAAGRQVDPEHFGMSIPYARREPAADVLAQLARRSGETDPRELLPVGRAALREMLAGYLDAGLSKFVVRPSSPVTSWTEEFGWLAEAILDLQT
jgi:probable F420-dependent oxidoreductase